MCLTGSYIKEARAAWKLLNGVICVCKPLGLTPARLQAEIRNKLKLGLNAMKVREPETFIEIRRIEAEARSNIEKSRINPNDDDLPSRNSSKGPPMSNLEKSLVKEVVSEFNDGSDKIQIVKRSNYADHPLVVGPRYQQQDIKLFDISQLGLDTSGLSILGINSGTKIVQKIFQMRWLRTYKVSGQFGISTDTGFHTGRIVDKSTYHKIRKQSLDRLLTSSQAAHQKNMFLASGVPLTSERAYQIASQGLPRPDIVTTPLVYSLKCTSFNPPDFDIEVVVINENEYFLKGLIHDFGLRLHTTGVCTKVQCIKYGPFTFDLALLPKHWDPQNIINNTLKTMEILKNINLTVRDPMVTSESDDHSISNKYLNQKGNN